MSKVIEVYVKNEYVPVQTDYSSFATDHAACRGTIYKEESYQKFKTKKVIAPTDTKALETIEKIAKQNDLILKVYNISTFKGRLKALSRGIKLTPTIVVGTHKITGVPKREELLAMI